MDVRWSLGQAGDRSPTGRGPGLVALLLLLVVGLLPVLGGGITACGEADGGDVLGPEPEPRPSPPSLGAGGDKIVDGADITGRIVTASVAPTTAGQGSDPVLAFLIEDGVGETDTASVTATQETRWYGIEPAGIAELAAAPDLAELTGARVAVAFYGPVAESYPVQATAGWVVLLD